MRCRFDGGTSESRVLMIIRLPKGSRISSSTIAAEMIVIEISGMGFVLPV
jgi:hypothetical protein